MNFNRKISVLGCGWLGFELAKYLISRGNKVNGSTTTSSKLEILDKAGIHPFILDLSESQDQLNKVFFQSDILILNIPPGKRDSTSVIDYWQKIEKALILAEMHGVQKVLLISSSGVFESKRSEGPNFKFQIYLADGRPNSTSTIALQLIQAEESLKKLFDNSGSIVRFGGLVGGDRKAGRFLSGRRNLVNAESPVNLIHRDDCIKIISQIIDQEAWGLTFNAVTDLHPSRKKFYTQQSKIQGFDPPQFKEGQDSTGKIISNQYLKERLKYNFIHPDPMKF